jgi:dolichyl-phosphate-mannose-protein mannosyltransferase
MLLTLPLLTGVLAGLALWRIRPGVDWREHVLGAGLVLGLLTVALAEGLSLVQALGPGGVALGWAVCTLAATLLAAAVWRGGPLRPTAWRPNRAELIDGALLLGPVMAIALATGLIALVGWPNNSDGMTYHLARIVYWLQQGSVAFYPTNIHRQLYNPPQTEYAQLQAMVLANDERAANLVQWTSMLGCLVGVSLIARRLGAGRRGQLFAVLFCATLPMGILQASSVQNDYGLAFWLVCLTAVLVTGPAKPPRAAALLAAGAALGLTLLAKGTSFTYAGPLVAALLLGRAWLGLRRLIVSGAVIGGLALLIFLPFLWRTVTLAAVPATPLATSSSSTSWAGDTVNGRLGLTALLSNLVRNLALHLGSPLPGADAAITQGVTALHGALGVAVDDPRTTYKALPFGVPPFAPDEGFAGNTLHLLLIVATLALLATGRRWAARPGGGRSALALALGLLLAFLLFSLLFRWQPFGSRLQLPAFVLWSPLVGSVLVGRVARRWLPVLLALPLVVWSWPFVVENRSHPLLGRSTIWNTERIDQYFHWRRPDQAALIGAVRYVQTSGCRDAGLLLDGDDYDYPLTVMLKGTPWNQAVQVHHIGLARWTQLLGLPLPRPCAAIDLRSAPNPPLEVDGQAYQMAWSTERVRVLTPRQP